MKIQKGQTLLILVAIEIAAWVISGQPWYQVSMTPNDSTVILKEFDGLNTYGYLSPILLVTLSAIAVALLTLGKSRSIILWTATAASSLLVALTIADIQTQNLAGVAKEIESATGVAASHGLTGLETITLGAASISIGIFALLTLAFGYAAKSSSTWIKKPTQTTKTTWVRTPKDAISLWDEQR